MLPPQFDEQFLTWFRKKSEKIWSTYEPMTREDCLESGIGGWTWQRETRWLDGLSEQEINEVEQHWQLQFPSDYHFFLKLLHSVDKKSLSFGYFGEGNLELREKASPTFFNWQTEEEEIAKAYEWVIEGMLFDVGNGIWWHGWGEKPTTAAAQEAHIRALVAAAPRIIPIIGHRYLLAEPCQAGNPILSIYQTDIIIYQPNLYAFFLHELATLSNSWPEKKNREIQAALRQQKKIWRKCLPEYQKIPFWGQFIQ